MFCKHCLDYAVHTVLIGAIMLSINIQVGFNSQHIPICVNYMHIHVSTSLLQWTFFMTTSGMHRRLFEGQHLETEYHILLPVHFSHSLKCIISDDTFPLMWTGFWYFASYDLAMRFPFSKLHNQLRYFSSNVNWFLIFCLLWHSSY